MSLAGTELEDLKPEVEKVVLKYGSSRDSVMKCAVKCVMNKLEKRKMVEKLSAYLDGSKASKLASKLDDIIYEFESKSRKRSKNGDVTDGIKSKRAKFQEENTDETPPAAAKTEPAPVTEIANDAPKPPEPVEETVAAPQLNAQQIKEMMENAQRVIMQRKQALEAQLSLAPGAPPLMRPGLPAFASPQQPGPQRFNQFPRVPSVANFRMNAVHQSAIDTKEEAERRRIELQNEIKMKLGAAGIVVTTNAEKEAKRPDVDAVVRKRSMFDVGPTIEVNRAPSAPQPGSLKLDERGRMVDASGNEIVIHQPLPELKANLRAIKRREKRENETGIQSVASLEPTLVEPAEIPQELSTSLFFDPRVNMKNSVRTSRRMQFHELGKFVKLGNQLRMKAQLEKVQSEINQLAKKTGISSVTKLALATSSIQKVDKLAGTEDIPDVEWWDVIVLKGKSYGETEEEVKANVNETRITNLIEHPTHVSNPGEANDDGVLPVFLTKKEQKKKRRQNRRETWKEKQEKIRLGLEPAPEPKVVIRFIFNKQNKINGIAMVHTRMTISNLMRVLGTDAVQDPTKVEAHVREQMAKRQRMHQEANAARKLTKDQKREKKIRKTKEDVSTGVRVSVYRVKSLTNAAKKFKIEMNCKQLLMTGCVVLHKDTNVVVVEGGPNQQKKFKRLMLQRIKWGEEKLKKESKDAEEADEEVDMNKCVLVWEGTMSERSFGEITFKFCPTESYAREFFKKRGVEHYWDLAYSGAILEAAEDN
ncbi:unnamed protein product [Notodromas monacha]|uniref:Uncharacterized protein n=1 Tax=Notodromas monacha TaxID=399045 RepID=A0A7R9BI56_9CRUS|nr:unnamed protein product [Notodromas monacha]CAG0915934.1 unnamed protein product [Notodromas monacha]